MANTTGTLTITEEHTYPLVVVGGGLAGICAAIAAAREGTKVALVQDRPVLGGNSSSEIRVHPVGASAHGYLRDARETGIMEEIFLHVRAHSYGLKQINGADYPLWDLTLLEKVQAEPNITLYLNTRVYATEMTDDGTRITAVVAHQHSTEKTFRLGCTMLVDASGDGVVAFQAGAPFRYGREARSEFGESKAPEQADDIVLGSTMMFAARDVARPVPFIPPAWAHRFTDEASLPFRDHSNFDQGYWWLEWGGRLNTISDNEQIRQELTAAILGVWDHIKNHCTVPGVREKAASYALEWVGQVPGKRESRRFEGDHMLTEHDVLSGWQTLPSDTVAYGGWPIDLHPPDGIYSPDEPCDNPQLPGIYGIPLRSLYSRTVENLLLAGRNISATHIAFGSTRVMKTCAVIGEASGTAAASALANNTTPRAIAHDGELLRELQQTLLRNGCYLPGQTNQDEADLTRLPGVAIQASSSAALVVDADDERNQFAWEYAGMSGAESPPNLPYDMPLAARLAQAWIVTEPQVESFTLRLRSERATPTTIRLVARAASHLRDFGNSDTPALGIAQAIVEPGEHMATFRFPTPLGLPRGQVVILLPETVEGVHWQILAQEPPGTQAARWNNQLGYWRWLHGTFYVATEQPQQPYEPEQVLSGVARPERGANMWVSDPAVPISAETPAWLELRWPKPIALSSVELTFDSGLSGWVWEGVFPTLVRDYTIDASNDGQQWQRLVEVCGNYQRRVVNTFEKVHATYLRLTITATNGLQTSRVCEVRVYADIN